MEQKVLTGVAMGIAVLLLVSIGIMFYYHQEQVELPPAPSYGHDAKMVDGVQVARLSWGKLNYDPEVIHLQRGVPARIEADLERLQGCFRSVEVPELGISVNLNEVNSEIEFTPHKQGTFNFGCSMGMGEGQIIVS